jgi:hypothetical protein
MQVNNIWCVKKQFIRPIIRIFQTAYYIKYYDIFDTCDGHVYCDYAGRQQERTIYLPLIIQGASYYSDIGESEYDSQISVSPMNVKQERIKFKKTRFVIIE